MTTLDRRWPPNRLVITGAIVGVLIGLSGAAEGSTLSAVIRVPGYPIAVAAIVQWVGIVRDRHVAWFAAHQVGMGLITVGWLMTDRTGGAVFNGAWFVIAAIWWFAAPRVRS